MEDLSSQILSDIEKDKVIQFCEDEVMFNAVKKYVLAAAYRHGIFEKNKEFKGNLNYALQLAWGATEPGGIPRSDEELGQDLRSLTKATKLVESGFKEIKEMKEVEKPLPEKNNPAE